jgi:Uma2 family endonuclease
MSLTIPATPVPARGIVYPEDDGLPRADNTRQLRWIVVLYGNLCALYRQVADVFVAANLLWYPEEGHPEICNAPDVMVIFGRSKGDRGSYRQWEEGGVPATVVFEILSPDSTATALADKFAFYEDHGVEEY